MSRYISLITFTDHGVKTIGDWDTRLMAARKRLEETGSKLVEAYLTFGPYDAVVITEAADDDTALRDALRYGLAGTGRSVTMRAFTEADAIRVTKSL
jgi:uncharacterized protein with GYD domain